MPRLKLIRKTTPKYKVAYRVNEDYLKRGGLLFDTSYEFKTFFAFSSAIDIV